MDTTNRTLTIGIDYSQIAKSVMARIAMAVAGRQAETALPFTRCRLQELAAINAQTACKEICSTLAGYVTDYTIDYRPCTTCNNAHSTMPHIGFAHRRCYHGTSRDRVSCIIARLYRRSTPSSSRSRQMLVVTAPTLVRSHYHNITTAISDVNTDAKKMHTKTGLSFTACSPPPTAVAS